jgi:hypothetical protein
MTCQGLDVGNCWGKRNIGSMDGLVGLGDGKVILYELGSDSMKCDKY